MTQASNLERATCQYDLSPKTQLLPQLPTTKSRIRIGRIVPFPTTIGGSKQLLPLSVSEVYQDQESEGPPSDVVERSVDVERR